MSTTDTVRVTHGHSLPASSLAKEFGPSTSEREPVSQRPSWSRPARHVLAVEPDERMARLAAAKGIRVEQASFEEWRPADREFDLVVFAQSFHWVDPRLALQKVAAILRKGGLGSRAGSARPASTHRTTPSRWSARQRPPARV
jgi:SAM-dependent methyltransferase